MTIVSEEWKICLKREAGVLLSVFSVMKTQTPRFSHWERFTGTVVASPFT